MRKILILSGAAAAFAVGCGGGGNSTAPVKLSGNPTNKGTQDLAGTSVTLDQNDFFFSPTFVKGGTPGATITVHVENKGQQEHNFTISAQGINKTLNPGETADVQVTLPQSGATEFHCRFHLQSNSMQGAFFFRDGDAVASA